MWLFKTVIPKVFFLVKRKREKEQRVWMGRLDLKKERAHVGHLGQPPAACAPLGEVIVHFVAESVDRLATNERDGGGREE
jgi:hypothetical protein